MLALSTGVREGVALRFVPDDFVLVRDSFVLVPDDFMLVSARGDLDTSDLLATRCFLVLMGALDADACCGLVGDASDGFRFVPTWRSGALNNVVMMGDDPFS